MSLCKHNWPQPKKNCFVLFVMLQICLLCIIVLRQNEPSGLRVRRHGDVTTHVSIFSLEAENMLTYGHLLFIGGTQGTFLLQFSTKSKCYSSMIAFCWYFHRTVKLWSSQNRNSFKISSFEILLLDLVLFNIFDFLLKSSGLVQFLRWGKVATVAL